MWRINFYHTESQYIAGVPTFSTTMMGLRGAVVNFAKNHARARGDYAYEVLPE